MDRLAWSASCFALSRLGASGGGGGGGEGGDPAPTPAADTTAPTVTITDDRASITNGAITYTFTFSEAVTGFTAEDVTVSNGAKGAFTAVSSTVYTLVVTPAAGFEGDVIVNVAAGAATDSASNASAAAVQSAQAADTKAPTVTITDDETGTASIGGGNVLYTFTFSEAVSGFTAADVNVTGGSKGAFTAVSGTV